ncbi:type IV toxin-antitoxin system AbiEi family antitoxin domain-containing protein [Roseateles sp.]|uniref:type IV toxin-antitoxin system AbiEi family antitoxin domain-containing protein n=1 Tax=Roseateles sp. TaxID=1971397 RepID=UPI0039E78A90
MSTEEPKRITIPAALGQVLGERGRPTVSFYELALAAWDLCKRTELHGVPLRAHKARLDWASFRRIHQLMLRNGVLRPIQGISGSPVYTLIGASVGDAKVLACAADPFCYISHLSAMEFHGLTDRMPEQLYISSPAHGPWKQFAAEQMQKDLGDDHADYLAAGLPQLQRSRPEKLLGKPVHQFNSLHLGAYRNFKEQHIRVATRGRIFLDMLRDPELCGGISHVLQVYQEHAKQSLRLILDEVDQHGKPIDKVRAGWILETLCQLRDPRIDAWTVFSQRGGSRKLDASAEYSPEFSERWALSINVPVLVE